MGYVNSQRVSKNKAVDKDVDSSWLPSQSSKTDDSWLPTISHNLTVTSESKGSRKVENDVDDSWLPAVGDSNGKYGTNANELENDVDYSWLPSSFIDNAKNIQKNGNINKNTTNIKAKNTKMSVDKNNKNSSNRHRDDYRLTLSWALVKEGICRIAQVYVCTERSRWRVLHGTIGTGTTIVQVFARYEGIFGSNEVVGMQSQHIFMVIVLGWIKEILPKLF
ncbi:hypothetical protein Hdeb2414_s0013g00414771 [Helianthus debilis subsp. tardiflorus]